MTFVRLWRILLAGTVEQSNTHRAEVVEGEGLGDIIDDSLHGDHLQNNKMMRQSFTVHAINN